MNTALTRNIGIFFVFGSVALSGCVNVKIGPDSELKRAEGVQLEAPSEPFAPQSRTDVDVAWKNSKNGNVISYLSDCKDSSDPTLEAITQGILAGLNHVKIESSTNVTVQARAGLRTLASGTVDGVASSTDLLVFKRNGCIYVLSLVGVSSVFEQDHQRFNQFINGFRAPWELRTPNSFALRAVLHCS